MRVWVIRHGKSAEGKPGQTDHDRPLNARGNKNGHAMQDWYADQERRAQWIWSSSAVRALSTAEYVAAGMGGELVVEPSLYLSTPETLLGVLRGTPAQIGERAVDSVAVVAHNPGMTQLVNLLVGKRVVDNMVTFASAQIEFNGDWPGLEFGAGSLVDITVPRSLPHA